MNISIKMDAKRKVRLRFRHMTTVDFFDEHGNFVATAESVCHPSDAFTKVEGEIHALDQLLEEWRPIHGVAVEVRPARRTRKAIWLQYFAKRAPEMLKDAVFGKGERS